MDFAHRHRQIGQAADMAEVEQLRIASKRYNAITEITEVISTYGLESEEFKVAYDAQLTSLCCPPEASFEWPAHITWARDRMSITAATDPNRWLARVSTEGLKQSGVAADAINAEQQYLLSEKIADCCKGQSGLFRLHPIYSTKCVTLLQQDLVPCADCRRFIFPFGAPVDVGYAFQIVFDTACEGCRHVGLARAADCYELMSVHKCC